jgi:hypothetical protein
MSETGPWIVKQWCESCNPEAGECRVLMTKDRATGCLNCRGFVWKKEAGEATESGGGGEQELSTFLFLLDWSCILTQSIE